MSSAIIKSFTLNLTKTYQGSPTSVTLGCVYSYNGNESSPMGIGYVLAVDDTITELRCFNEGIQGMQSFMNTDKFEVQVSGGKTIQSFRLGFSDKGGELLGFMMQGPDGDDIVTTDNYEKEDLQAFKLS